MKFYRLPSLPFEVRNIAAAALICIPVVSICMLTIANLHAQNLYHAQEQQLRQLTPSLKPIFEQSTNNSDDRILKILKDINRSNVEITEIQWQKGDGTTHVIHEPSEMQRYPSWFSAIIGIPPNSLTIPLMRDRLALHVGPTSLLNITWRFFKTILLLSFIGVVIFLGGLYALLVNIYAPIRQSANVLEQHIQHGEPWTFTAEGTHDWSRIVNAINKLIQQMETLREDHAKLQADTLDDSRTLHVMLEALPIPVCVRDINGIEKMRNRAFIELFQLKNPSSPLPFDAQTTEQDRKTDREVQERLKPTAYEMICQIENCGNKTLKISKSPLLTPKGVIKGVIVIIEDFTVQRNSEAELRSADYEIANLRASNRAKNTFIANISHEMRTPLTAIIGFSETLLDHDQTMADRIDGIKTIIRAGKHLHRIINEVLDLAKLESGKLDLEYTDVNLFGFLDEITSLAKIQARNNGASFNIQYRFPLPVTIHCDPIRTKQILYNLIGNAIKFTRGGAIELEVRLNLEKKQIAFSIKDNGIGIAPDRLSILFMPFAQADISTTRNYGGTGLGLYLSRTLANSMGGDITVTSELGKGSCFTAQISTGPISENTLTYVPIAPIQELETYAQPDMIKGTVLIVDDQPDNRRLVEIYLRKLGVKCLLAENGEEALATIEKMPLDLVLMDINMPIMDGITAIRRLRERGYTGTVFAFTADVAREDIDRCHNAGFNDFIPKPIDRQLLISKVSAQLIPAQETPLQPSPLLSTLPLTDPANLELIRFFADVLPIRLKELMNAYSLGNWNEIQEKAATLQDIGSGYGYPKVTETAAKLRFCAAKADKVETKLMLDRLKYLADCIVLGTQEALISDKHPSLGASGGT